MEAMAHTFGAIEREGRGPIWTAHAWQWDGTSVGLSVDPAERQVEVYLDTRGLERPQPPPRSWVWALIAVIVIAAVAIGLWARSVLLGVGLLVVGFGGWIGRDVARQVAAERRRKVDVVWWAAHLEACIRRASRPDGG